MSNEEKETIRKLLVSFKKWLYQENEYACAKNDRERRKIVQNGTFIKAQMEKDLLQIEKLINDDTNRNGLQAV